MPKKASPKTTRPAGALAFALLSICAMITAACSLDPDLESLREEIIDSASAVTGVTLNAETRSLTAGETFRLTADVMPVNAADKRVSWKSSNDAVATVSSGGLVTAAGEGTATITVTTNTGGLTDTCEVTVHQPQAY